MLGWNQVGRRLIVGTAILSRRNFAHSLCHGFPLRLYAEREAEWGRRVQTVPRQHSRAPGVHVHAHTYIHPIYAYVRDCIYAESYLPRLKSHREESRGRSALGIASTRAVILPRCASLPFLPFRALPPPQWWCIAAAVCRCIVSIFTRGRRAGGLLSFPRFFPTSRTPCRAGKR